MDDGQHDAAWQRIEAALARLGKAADMRAKQRSWGEQALEAQLRAERARHEALRGALRETLGRIDTLIAAHTPDSAGQPDTAGTKA
jgi:ferric-dicitrate binding protein FerR (iron transport regulator)